VRGWPIAVKRKQWEPLAFAAPSLALIALVILFPLAYSFYLSLQNFDLSVGSEYEFIGGKNYVEALFSASSARSGIPPSSSRPPWPSSCCSGSGSRSSSLAP